MEWELGRRRRSGGFLVGDLLQQLLLLGDQLQGIVVVVSSEDVEGVSGGHFWRRREGGRVAEP